MNTTTPVETKFPSLIDRHIGDRLRARRELRRISPETLAKLIGIGLTELQAIEEGRAEACPKSLLLASDVLNVHARYFFLEFNSQGTTS